MNDLGFSIDDIISRVATRIREHYSKEDVKGIVDEIVTEETELCSYLDVEYSSCPETNCQNCLYDYRHSGELIEFLKAGLSGDR